MPCFAIPVWRPELVNLMLRNTSISLLLLSLSIAGSSALAETVFVIDRLLVGVHKEKGLDSDILKVFPTGTQLEVLERDEDLARIKGPEDVTGWVDASYLTSKKPAQVLLAEVQAELETLKQNIPITDEQLEQANERLKQQAASERLKVAELQAQLSRLENKQDQEGSNNNNELERLRIENARLTDAMNQQKDASLAHFTELARQLLNDGQVRYYLIALLLSLLLAFLCGLQFMDWLQRRRHGGFRI